MSRLQPVDPATLPPEGRAVYDKIANSPRGGVPLGLQGLENRFPVLINKVYP